MSGFGLRFCEEGLLDIDQFKVVLGIPIRAKEHKRWAQSN